MYAAAETVEQVQNDMQGPRSLGPGCPTGDGCRGEAEDATRRASDGVTGNQESMTGLGAEMPDSSSCTEDLQGADGCLTRRTERSTAGRRSRPKRAEAGMHGCSP